MMNIKLYFISFILFIYNSINSLINYICPIQYINLYNDNNKNIIHYNRFKTFFIYLLNIKIEGLMEFELFNNNIYNKLIYNGNNLKYYINHLLKDVNNNYSLKYMIMNYNISINNNILNIKPIIMKLLSFNTSFNTFEYILKLYYPNIILNDNDIINVNFKYIFKGKIFNNNININLFDNINIIFS